MSGNGSSQSRGGGKSFRGNRGGVSNVCCFPPHYPPKLTNGSAADKDRQQTPCAHTPNQNKKKRGNEIICPLDGVLPKMRDMADRNVSTLNQLLEPIDSNMSVIGCLTNTLLKITVGDNMCDGHNVNNNSESHDLAQPFGNQMSSSAAAASAEAQPGVTEERGVLFQNKLTSCVLIN